MVGVAFSLASLYPLTARVSLQLPAIARQWFNSLSRAEYLRVEQYTARTVSNNHFHASPGVLTTACELHNR